MMLAICEENGSHFVSIYDLSSYSFAKRYAAHIDPVHCLCFSRDSQYLAAGSNKTVVISEIESEQHTQMHSFPDVVVAVTFNIMGDKILGRSLTGLIRCYNLTCSEMEYEYSCQRCLYPCLSYDSKDQHIISQFERGIGCWDVATKEVVASVKCKYAVGISENDLLATAKAASIYEAEIITIWKLPFFEFCTSIQPDWATKRMCFNAQGTLLAAGHSTKIGLWHLESGTLHHVLTLDQGKGSLENIAFLPHSDSILIISKSSEGTIVINTETNETLLRAPCGHMLCVSAGGVILL